MDTTTSAMPKNHAQNPAVASRGNANDRAPTCNGTTATPMPSMTGSTAKKARPTRLIENNWSRLFAPRLTELTSMRSNPSNPPTTAMPNKATRPVPNSIRPSRL